jgi:hypothetical protein
MKRMFFYFFALASLPACKNLRHQAFEYEIMIRAKENPYSPTKFVSYRNLLIQASFNRYDSTIENRRIDSIVEYTRFDTSERWIIKKENAVCYKIDTWGPAFKIIDRDSLKNRMEGGMGGGYVFDKELRDTAIDGVQYYYADSTAYNSHDSMDVKYYFVKTPSLNTIYTFLNIGHKNPAYQYAGFTMDDYKYQYRFVNLLINLKEADEKTLRLCEAIYERFKKEVK